MPSKIITKHSTTVGAKPTAAQLEVGELAVNTEDPSLYTKNSSGVVVAVTPSSNEVASKMARYVDLEDFGAVADGTIDGVTTTGTDNTTAIQAAFDYAAANDFIVRARGGNYLVNDRLYLECHAELANCTFIYSEAYSDYYSLCVCPDKTITGTAELVRYKNIELPQVIKAKDTTTGTWVTGTHGVTLVNVYNSSIRVSKIENFNYGLFMYGTGGRGNVYNRIELTHLSNNKTNLQCYTTTDGWCNQNVFYGGQLSFYSSEAESTRVAQVDTFNGDGTTVDFELTAVPEDYGDALVTTVVVDSVTQVYGTDYTIDPYYPDSGNTGALLTFKAGSEPASGTGNIVVTYTSETRVSGTRHVVLTQAAGATYAGVNNNTFINLSLEGAVDQYALLLQGCSYNQFINCRYERGGMAGKTIRIEDKNGDYSSYNQFMYGHTLNLVNIVETTNGSRNNHFFSDYGLRLPTSGTDYPTIGLGNNSDQDQPLLAAYRKEKGDPYITSSTMKNNGWITAITPQGLQHHDDRNATNSTVAIEDDGIKLGAGANTPLKRLGGNDYAETSEITDQFNGDGSTDTFTYTNRVAFTKTVTVSNYTGTMSAWAGVALRAQSSTYPNPCDVNGENGYHYIYTPRGQREIQFAPNAIPPTGTNNIEVVYTDWATYPRMDVTYADVRLYDSQYDQNRLMFTNTSGGNTTYIWTDDSGTPRFNTTEPTAHDDGTSMSGPIFSHGGFVPAASGVTSQFGTNATVSYVSAGQYRVTFDSAQADTNYTVLTSCSITPTTDRRVEYGTKTTTYVDIYVVNASGQAVSTSLPNNISFSVMR